MRVDGSALLWAVLSLGVTLLTASCGGENRSGPIDEGNTTVSEERFSLSAEQRARLRPGIDVEALERLLAAVPPERRDTVLQSFENTPGGRGRGRYYITRFDDPKLQRLLEAVRQSSGPRDAAEASRAERQRRDEALRRDSVTLALVPNLGSDRVTARVVRRGGPSPQDIILLRESDADAGRLTAALNALVRSRQKHGLVPPQDMELRVSVAQGPRIWLEGSARAWWEEKIRELRSAPAREIPGVGKVRAMNYQLIGGKR